MHDLGRMGLLAAHPTEYTRLALAAHDTEADIRAAEQAQFGMDHCRAGSLLARAWGLPEALHRTAECHHEESCRGDLLSLVHLSCRLHLRRFRAIATRPLFHPGRRTDAELLD